MNMRGAERTVRLNELAVNRNYNMHASRTSDLDVEHTGTLLSFKLVLDAE